MVLQIEAVWRPRHTFRKYLSSHILPEVALDEVATCTLRLSANNRLMTKVVDDNRNPTMDLAFPRSGLPSGYCGTGGESDGSHPAPKPTACPGNKHTKRRASVADGSGHGITFDSDGHNVGISSAVSEATVTEPVSFLGEEDEQFVSAPAFEQGVDLLCPGSHLSACRQQSHSQFGFEDVGGTPRREKRFRPDNISPL